MTTQRLTNERSEWRDPWLRTAVVIGIVYSLAVLAFAIHYIWMHQ